MSTLRKFIFLALPGELRNQIYGLLLDLKAMGIEDSCAARIDPCRMKGKWRSRLPKRSSWSLHPNVLATNRVVHDEAAGVLYGNNRFLCELDRWVMQNPPGLCQLEWPLEGFTSPENYRLIGVLVVSIKEGVLRPLDNSYYNFGTMQVLRDQIKLLCGLVSNSKSMNLEIDYEDVYYDRVLSSEGDHFIQRREDKIAQAEGILNLFEVLRNVKKVTISGTCLSSTYKAKLKAIMEGP